MAPEDKTVKARAASRGDDPEHDLSAVEKDAREAKLRKEAGEHLSKGDKKARDKTLARANEISRRKSKKAHQHGF